MSVGLALLLGAAAGAILGACAVRYDLPAWLLACWASVLGAQWYSPRQHCPPCGRQVHLLRYHEVREGTFGLGDDGKRCIGCSHRTPRVAPERPESPDAGLSVLGWPGVPGSAQGHAEPSAIQDRTDERK